MKVIGERKAVAARLAEITGEAVVYTRMPRCAYEVGHYTIGRDGSITVDEGADLEPLYVLAREGLVSVEELLPVRSGEDEGLSQDERCEEQPECREGQDQLDCSEAFDAPESDNEQNAPLIVSIPLANHTVTSLKNLITMVYSRGALLSKATGGSFACSVELIGALKDCITVEDAVARLTPDLAGLSVADDKINFVFPYTEDAEKVFVFTQLATQMNKAAKAAKRVVAKTTDTTNEKYIFRIWLLSLGMGGDEFKTARRLLLAPLSVNAAFKDAAMEQRWKEKRAAERLVADEQKVADKQEVV